MPAKMGAKNTSIYDAEATALLHIICEQALGAGAPAVSDSQNVVDLVARGTGTSLRDRSRGPNNPLENRIRRRLKALAQATAQEGAGPVGIGDERLEAALQTAPSMGLR